MAEPSALPADVQARVFAYRVLARLLLAPPEAGLLASLADIRPLPADPSAHTQGSSREDALAPAWEALALQAVSADPDALEQEYNDLFIGLGRGQLVPYGSWYATGFLMDRPLAALRADLDALGFERDAQRREPEDHMGALFEVMSMLIASDAESDDGAAPALAEQRQFFLRHIEPWAKAFFRDLGTATSAAFYRPVGRLGEALVDFEVRYLKMLN